MDGDAVRAVPVQISPTTTSPVGPTPWCRAPSGHLYLAPWGEVRSCCQQRFPLGSIAEQSLLDIWRGAQRAHLVRSVARGDLSQGCASCAVEAENEGRELAYAALFDDLPDAEPGGWPSRIEFNLSNLCNLQCIQCNPQLSSAIRAHQTDLPPIPKVYDDRFFEDLATFLPHLEEAQFAGGEPFLAPENYRVWDLIAEVAPHVRCTVVTNATVWTPRVERVLDRMSMDLVLSIDAIFPATYEAIRIGADFDQVMANFERFSTYARSRGTSLTINHCLMAQNVHEFADLLLFADAADVSVDVCVVREPDHCALAMVEPAELAEVADLLAEQGRTTAAGLGRNRLTWEREVARIAAWAAAGPSERQAAYLVTRHAQTISFPSGVALSVDVDEVLEELRAFAAGGPVVELHLVDGVIAWHTPAIGAILGLEDDGLLGQTPDVFVEATGRAFGAQLAEDFERNAVGRIDITTTFERAVARAVIVPGDDDLLVFRVGVRLLDGEAGPSAGGHAI